jgi:demethylmenaquinone methyltransferase/2-methoxy-6-polyprenyl-1,4-benzoquinol methylase
VRRDVGAFDRLARLYDLAMPSADRRVLERGLAAAARDVERVLDVGGGSGRAARALRGPPDGPVRPPGTDDREFLVVDAAPGMLAVARRTGLRTVRADAGRLPIRDACADAVMVVDALHHLPDRRAAIAAAERVLRPGGVLVVREVDPSTLLGRVVVATEHALGFDSAFLSPDDLAALLEDVGLRASVPDRGFGYTVVGLKGD